MEQFPVLQTKRLSLREFHPSDAQALFDSFSQETVTQFLNRGPMQSITEAEALVKIRASLFERGIGIRWAIVLKSNPEYMIGSCGFYKLNKDDHSAEIGYDLNSTYWRQGIMTGTLKTVINFAYSEDFFFHLNRIQALTYLDHVASIGLLIKLGFQEEGVLRDAGYWEDKYHNLRSFSLLRKDWKHGQTMMNSVQDYS